MIGAMWLACGPMGHAAEVQVHLGSGWYGPSYGLGWGRHHGARYRWDRRDNRYRYDPWFQHYRQDLRRRERTRRAVTRPAPVTVIPERQRTVQHDTTARGSRAALPANARIVQTDAGTRYLWQGVCYRFDWQQKRYQAEDCPESN
ncbi:hypothetical protein GCM10023333_27860 [Ferrimonas pelagia]|uniref:YXWGXW repeat-containing protein n=1 Tax=Ferrimonas pelagia TaxID=1177826 RepID=A0ABP9F3C2_9GAMM